MKQENKFFELRVHFSLFRRKQFLIPFCWVYTSQPKDLYWTSKKILKNYHTKRPSRYKNYESSIVYPLVVYVPRRKVGAFFSDISTYYKAVEKTNGLANAFYRLMEELNNTNVKRSIPLK